MPNFKVTYEEKLQAILEYLNEDTSQKAVAKNMLFLKLRFKRG